MPEPHTSRTEQASGSPTAAADHPAGGSDAANYVAWERANYYKQGLDKLDEATAAASLLGAEW